MTYAFAQHFLFATTPLSLAFPVPHQSLANKTSLLPAFLSPSPCSLPSVLGQLGIDENLVVGLALCLHRRPLPIQRTAVQVQPAPHRGHHSNAQVSQQQPCDLQRLGCVDADLGGIELVEPRPVVGGTHPEGVAGFGRARRRVHVAHLPPPRWGEQPENKQQQVCVAGLGAHGECDVAAACRARRGAARLSFAHLLHSAVVYCVNVPRYL